MGVDTSGVFALEELHQELASNDIRVHLYFSIKCYSFTIVTYVGSLDFQITNICFMFVGCS